MMLQYSHMLGYITHSIDNNNKLFVSNKTAGVPMDGFTLPYVFKIGCLHLLVGQFLDGFGLLGRGFFALLLGTCLSFALELLGLDERRKAALVVVQVTDHWVHFQVEGGDKGLESLRIFGASELEHAEETDGEELGVHEVVPHARHLSEDLLDVVTVSLRADVGRSFGLGPLFQHSLVRTVSGRGFIKGGDESIEQLSLFLLAKGLEHLVEDAGDTESEDRVV
mmetsp:Transcript_29014/g.56494  ORF Transcript_29014/g.56494 Transcript_29014/m.56494 type:complete len:223 (+) Transcript_29014:54-722(+)